MKIDCENCIFGITRGMIDGITRAITLGKSIEYREIFLNSKPDKSIENGHIRH